MPPYKRKAMQEIDAVVRKVQRTPDSIASDNPFDRAEPCQRPAQFKNDSGGTIPAFACMKVDDGDKHAIGPGVPYFLATKPGTTLLTDRFAMNGPRPVASNDHGECYLSGHVRALYNTGTPAAGDAYGPTPGQWYLTKNYPPIFRVATIANATDKHAHGELHSIELLRGELKDNLPFSGPVTPGQTATAYFLDEAGDIVTDVEFEVTDVFGQYRGRGWFSWEVRGSQFYAKFMPDTDEWEIAWLQPHALRISGETSAVVYYDDTEFTATATPVIMNPTGAIALHDYTTADLIKNPLELQYASGDTFHAEWNEKATTPQWEAVDVGRPRPHRISGETSAVVYYDDTEFTATATPVIMNPVDAISEEDYTVANLIKNPLELQYASGDTFHAEWNITEEQWEAVGPTSTFQARWLLFTASAPFLTGGTITIDARTYYDGEDPAADVTSILNPLNLTGYNNCTGIAIINTKVSPPTYTAVNVSPVAEDIVTDFQVDTSNNELETKARSISIMPRGDESAWGVAPGYKHTGDDCT